MRVFIALAIIYAAVVFWPVTLGLILLFFVVKHWRPFESKKAHIGYVIIKDDLGKFGITQKSAKNHTTCVKKRYAYRPLTVLWTGQFKSKRAALDFERYCKSQVRHIVKGREWISQQEAHTLAARLGRVQPP